MKKLFILLNLMIIFAVSGITYGQTVRSSWNVGFGFSYPRFQSSDLRPQESNYGGYLSLQRYFSEAVSLRLKGSFLSLYGRVPGGMFLYTNGAVVPSMTEYVRTSVLGADLALLYNLSPCSSVSPYVGLGVGVVATDPKWPSTIVNPQAEKKTAAEFNLVFGAEWRLSQRWKLVTDLAFHTTDTQIDGIVNNNRQGMFGSNTDAYIALSAGFQYYFSLGEPSKYCDLYEGIKVQMPEMNYPTLDQIEEIIKRYAAEPTKIDYDRIEDIIKRNMTRAPQQQNWTLFGVNFEFNKSTLTPEASPILEHAVEMLKENPDLKVEIQGYTDNVGSDAYNQKLSEARANTVKDYLTQKGIEASRLTAVGFGKSNPIADNNTAAGRAQNRRVEFKVSK